MCTLSNTNSIFMHVLHAQSDSRLCFVYNHVCYYFERGRRLCSAIYKIAESNSTRELLLFTDMAMCGGLIRLSMAICGLIRLSMALCDLVCSCMAFMSFLWFSIAFYGLLWQDIVFSRGHRSRFIWSCLS